MSNIQRPFQTYERPGLVVSYKMAVGTIYEGHLVGLNDKGLAYALTSSSPSNTKFIGVAAENKICDKGGSVEINVTKAGAFVFQSCNLYDDIGQNPQEIMGHEMTAFDSTTVGYTDKPGVKVGTLVKIEQASTGKPGFRIRIERHTC